MLGLIESFFDDPNPYFRALCKATIVDLCERHFPIDRNSGAAGVVGLLEHDCSALATRRKALNAAFGTVSGYSWAYLKNAFAVFTTRSWARSRASSASRQSCL